MLEVAQNSINGLNLYCYCLNNPTNDVDNDGKASWWQWLLFGIGAVLVVAAAVVLTVVSGGTALSLAGAIAVGAAKGALIGAAIGSVAGIAGGAIYSAVTGAGMGQSILSGFLMGFGIGAIAGAVIGGMVGGITYNPIAPSGLSKSSIKQGIKSLTKNDMNHIISKSQHNFGKVLSKVNNYTVKSLLKNTLYNGTMTNLNHIEIALKLATGTPTVRGMLIKGIFRIGTFFVV